MTVNISKPAMNLRALLARIIGLEQRIDAHPFINEKFAGDASTTAFASEKGFKALMVFDAGLLQREGSSEDYTLSTDGYIWTVTFAVAPAVGDVTFLSARVS